MGQREGQDDKPPILFRGRYVPHWAVATGIVLSLMAYFQYMGHDSLIDLTKDGVEAMLHATAGIFATMLAVTLGVTLLGVQFRSQSYTMSGMLEYMKDKVVYGFITVFVAGTILSMVVAGDPGSSPGWTALYALTCMALALCYHAAYIFHLIYKLQLSQMLSDNDKKILKYIDDAEKRDRLYTRFEIWEGIMEKAAETRNRSIFERGLKSAFSTMKKCIEDPKTFDKLEECTEAICRSCIDRGQYRFVDMYVTELLKMRLVLSHAEKSDVEWIYAVRSWMMGELEGIMRKATDGDEEGACQDYIEWTMESLWDDIRSNDDWDQIEVMCDCTERAIRYGILRDGGVAELFVDMVAEESRKDHQGTRKVFVLDFLKNSEYVLVWYSRIFRILKSISLKMARNGEEFTFIVCTIVMMRLCDKYENLITEQKISDTIDSTGLEIIHMFSNHMSEVINASITWNRHSIIVAFNNILKYEMPEMTRSYYRGESGKIWRRALWVMFGAIMSRASYTDDQATLSTVSIKTDILNHMLDKCDREEVESIIEADIKYVRNAFDSAAGKSHTGTIEMLVDLHRRMEKMLRGRWENDLADHYVEALEGFRGAGKPWHGVGSAAFTGSDSGSDEQGKETQAR